MQITDIQSIAEEMTRFRKLFNDLPGNRQSPAFTDASSVLENLINGFPKVIQQHKDHLEKAATSKQEWDKLAGVCDGLRKALGAANKERDAVQETATKLKAEKETRSNLIRDHFTAITDAFKQKVATEVDVRLGVKTKEIRAQINNDCAQNLARRKFKYETKFYKRVDSEIKRRQEVANTDDDCNAGVPKRTFDDAFGSNATEASPETFEWSRPTLTAINEGIAKLQATLDVLHRDGQAERSLAPDSAAGTGTASMAEVKEALNNSFGRMANVVATKVRQTLTSRAAPSRPYGVLQQASFWEPAVPRIQQHLDCIAPVVEAGNLVCADVEFLMWKLISNTGASNAVSNILRYTHPGFWVCIKAVLDGSLLGEAGVNEGERCRIHRSVCIAASAVPLDSGGVRRGLCLRRA